MSTIHRHGGEEVTPKMHVDGFLERAEYKESHRYSSQRLGAATICCLSFSEAVDTICELAAGKTRGNLVTTPNIQHIVELERNAEFREAYSKASLVLPDGWPVVAAIRLLGTRCAERVPGSDLLPAVSAEAANRGLTVGFMGGLPNAASEAAAELATKYPKLQVAVTHEAPPGFDRTPDSTRAVINAVAMAAPDILFLGFGAPRQEIFALHHLDQLGARVIMCVGAAIDFTAGARPRAPEAVRKLGLEWLFRVLIEPKRLGPRYAKAAPRFAWIVLRQLGAKWT
jgi:N-acetylglucosaminyldiphosphoundecaprenol N-acetyl-beta-D-mannosaminyltransferase